MKTTISEITTHNQLNSLKFNRVFIHFIQYGDNREVKVLATLAGYLTKESGIGPVLHYWKVADRLGNTAKLTINPEDTQHGYLLISDVYIGEIVIINVEI